MSVCSQCGATNRDGARYCSSCAAPLQPQPRENACPRCGTQNLPQARYCHYCAAPLGDTTATATGTLAPQTMLAGRYLILEKVGQGGMGAVYKTADARIPNKLWAVKELSDAAMSNPEDKLQAAQAFAQEAQMLSRLNHANLPKVVDHLSENGKQYLVMDFVEGETLEDKCARRGEQPFSEAEVLHWARQLCEVLAYLHQQSPPIVFRDLKPGNIMIDDQGRVKLIDFGIARLFKPGKATDTASFGTAGYAPPEQYGKSQTDARSDLYALGATMHQLLTGCDPALTPFQFAPVRGLNPAISPEMESVVMRAVERDPAKRWPDAEAMRQALEGIGGRVSRPPTPASAVARPAGAPQRATAQPASRPAAQQLVVPSPASAVPKQRKGSKGLGWLVAILVLCAIGIGIGVAIEQTNSSAARATAQARMEATARAKTAATEQARARFTATAAAQAQATATAQARATATVRARATETAQKVDATATTAAERGKRMKWPVNGSLAHEDDDYIEVQSADVQLRDFMTEAVFVNPYDASEAGWDYGFLFRWNPGGTFYSVWVDSDGDWGLRLRMEGERYPVQSGHLSDVNRSVGGRNRLRVIATGNEGLFYVNGKLVAQLDLSGLNRTGDVKVATGLFSGNEIPGRATRFEEFTVWSLH
jgi:serine/threonine-protein kinase